MIQTAFRDPNSALIAARIFVQEYIEDQAEKSHLLAIAKDEESTVRHLARTILAPQLSAGIISRAMIMRWVMEAVVNASMPD